MSSSCRKKGEKWTYPIVGVSRDDSKRWEVVHACVFRLKPGAHDGGSVRYEGLEGDTVQIKEPEDALRTVTDASGRDSFTVDDAVEYLGFGKFQAKLSILTGLAWVSTNPCLYKESCAYIYFATLDGGRNGDDDFKHSVARPLLRMGD